MEHIQIIIKYIDLCTWDKSYTPDKTYEWPNSGSFNTLTEQNGFDWLFADILQQPTAQTTRSEVSL